MTTAVNSDLSYVGLIRQFKGNIRNFNLEQKEQSDRKYDNEGFTYYSVDSNGNISSNILRDNIYDDGDIEDLYD